MEQITLEQQDVHLWLARHDSALDSDQYKRRVLARYGAGGAQSIAFERGAHGKPALCRTTPARPALQFNLSHSGDWRVLAVAASAPLGVDLQTTVTRQDEMKLARRFFSPQEVQALQGLPAEQRAGRFYDLWVLKEAAVKARGEALPPQLSRRCFSFVPSGQQAPAWTLRACEGSHPDTAHPDTAHYALYEPLSAYRLALCWLGTPDVAPRVSLFREAQVGQSATWPGVRAPLPAPLAASHLQRC